MEMRLESDGITRSRPGSNRQVDKQERRNVRKKIASNNSRLRMATDVSNPTSSASQDPFEPVPLVRSQQSFASGELEEQEHNEKALVLIDRVKLKLSGMEFHNEQTVSKQASKVRLQGALMALLQAPDLNASLLEASFSPFTQQQDVTVDEQVKLITAQATSSENLCQAYMGWFPYW